MTLSRYKLLQLKNAYQNNFKNTEFSKGRWLKDVENIINANIYPEPFRDIWRNMYNAVKENESNRDAD